MNKADLISSVARKARISKTDASVAVDSLVKSIQESLGKGKTAVVVGFGSFSVAKRAARTGRNPQTREPIQIPARKVPRFRAGKLLKTVVRRG